jgi:hypothetical protein
MQTDNPYALFPEYQREMRALIAQLTDQHRYDGQTKAIVKLLQAGKTDDALLEVLQLRSSLKSFLEVMRQIFAELLDAEAQAFLKYVELRQKAFAALAEAALEAGKPEDAALPARELNRMSEYFATAITYLDFEPGH